MPSSAMIELFLEFLKQTESALKLTIY